MNFQIDIHPRAVADLDGIHAYISDYASAAADRTCDLIKQAILGLEDFPRRYALAPESRRASLELRHLIVGNYRAVYTILDDKVHVWRVVHAAQRINPAEFF